MDSSQNPGEGQENTHPDQLINENPLSSSINSGIVFIQSYGWFILLGVIVCLYIKSKLYPKVEQMKRRYEEERESKKFDASAAQSKMEAMMAARQRLQDQHDAQAALYAEKMKQKEEEKRKQKIDDWEGHQQGKGYRSKYKPTEASTSSASTQPKPKAKSLRDPDYNPLAGDGGSCSWRPAQRRSGGG